MVKSEGFVIPRSLHAAAHGKRAPIPVRPRERSRTSPPKSTNPLGASCARREVDRPQYRRRGCASSSGGSNMHAEARPYVSDAGIDDEGHQEAPIDDALAERDHSRSADTIEQDFRAAEKRTAK